MEMAELAEIVKSSIDSEHAELVADVLLSAEAFVKTKKVTDREQTFLKLAKAVRAVESVD